MASFPDLRPNRRSATAESLAASKNRARLFLAVSTALLCTASLAVSELATLHGARAHDTSAFLTRELGPPLDSTLVRTPAHSSPAFVKPALGGKLEIRKGGLKVTSGKSSVSLRFGSTRGSWQGHVHGVQRKLPFGTESIVLGTNSVEQSLTVAKRQGTRTWRWRLDARDLRTRVTLDGTVRFANAKSDAGLRIQPVVIFDQDHKVVTPSGLRWSVVGDGNRRWLQLRLNDAKLPLPYVIDPIALVAACPGGGCATATTTSSTTVVVTRPASVATGTLMLAQVTLRNNDAITAPAGWTTTGNLRASGATLEQRIYYRIATAADTAATTYTWSWTTTSDGAAAILAYSGTDATNPIDVTPTDNAGSSLSASATGLTTTQDNDMLDAFYGVQGQSGPAVTATQDAAQGLTQEYTIASGSAPASRARSTGADGTQATAGATGNKTATLSTSTPWVAHLVALMPPLAVDGAGTLTTPTTNVSASQTGNTVTFTYTAAAGGMNNGSLTLVVPAGWTAPSTVSNNAGYTTASTGTVSVASQTITVSSLTLAGGGTMTLTYGNKSGGGSGATATASTGAQTWQAQQKARSAGTLTNLGSSPSITMNAADGSGTLTTGTSAVSASQTGNTITFTYTAATGGINNGTVTLVVPAGWTAPSTTAANAGYTTSSAGTVSVAGQTITISSLTLAGAGSATITYGSTVGGGSGATATSTTGAQTWQAQEKSTSGGAVANLGSSPSITVYAGDGSGTLTTGTSVVSASQTGRTITFTYTAATGGISNGSVTLVVPAGWTAPSTTGANAGFTTSSAGSVSVAGQTITVSSLTLAGGATATITYGSTASGGSGATATSTTGAQTWQAQEKSTSGGVLGNLGSSPSITVYAADGSGTLTSGTSVVSASQTGRTITFTYTAAAGGINNGTVTLVVPAGWSAPSTTGANAGYTTASSGTLSAAAQTITVSSLTVAGGSTFTITYGSTASGGPGATATSSTGAQTWQAQAKSTSAGSLANLGSSPSITVYAADGSGTLTTGTSAVSASQTGRTITFTYTAAAGGINNGSVTLVVPAGWSAPSMTGANAGYTTASSGTVSVAAQTITVSSLTVAGGSTFTITYGDTGGGGLGATATSSTGAQTWQAQAKSTSTGSLANLGSSPSVTVYAADGSGTLTTPTTNVSASQTGRTITFTYTAAAGGINNGSVTLVVPAGWSAPSTTGANAGYTTASSGTVSVAAQTITVSSLTIAGGSTFTITYGSTASAGPGATATASTGAQTWQAQAKSTAAGSLANLGSSPSVTVNAADGSGTLTAGTSAVSASQTGRTIMFTYTAPTGGISNGSVTLVVPAGWNAPSTTGANAGYTTSSSGTVSVAAQTITVSSLTLASGNTATITYGDTGGGGSGATATSSTGAQTWQAQAKSTAAGSLANLGSSPSITVYATDGSGTLTTPTSVVSASQTGRTLTFTYTAPAGGISNGSVTLAVPAGWSAPSTTGANAGYSTSSSGTLSVAGQTITVSSLTLAVGNTFTITYGDTGSGGPGATATSSTGAQTWQAQEKSTAGGSLANLGASPSVTVYAADGSGTLTTPTTSVVASQTGRTLTFTYTVAAGGINNGTVTLAVPAGWSAPSTTGANAGYSTSSSGTLTVSGQTITVASLTLAGGNTFTVTYGSTAGGGPGATATASTGAQTWQAQEKSTASGSLANLAASPSVTVYAADGSGTLTTPTASVPFASTGNSLTFTYTAAAGGISNGSVTLAVPAGWNAPSTTGANGGYSTSSAGTLTVSGQTITVASLTLAGGNTFTITYGSTAGGGPGATAPSAGGAQTWQAQEKSISTSSLANLASSPSVTVLAFDGSGTLTTPTGSVNSAQTGRTITFTYTAAAGGISNASVTLVVPAGWNAPSTTGANAGYSTSSSGTLTVSGQTITIASVTLGAGSTFTITYGDTSGGGPGATAPVPAGAQTWQAQEKSSSAGTLMNLATSPSINVVDVTAPSAPSLNFGSFTNASATGTTVYIRQGAAGGFTVTGTSSDTESGIDHLTFASGLGAGWTGGGADSSSPYTGVYTFSSAATAPVGNQDVTSTNGSALTSSSTPFTVVSDTTAPSVTAPTVTAGYYTSLSVPVTKNGGTDGGSGVDNTTSAVERDEIALSNGTCGTFPGTWTSVTLVGGNDTTVVSGKCYRYRETLSDKVGNPGASAASNTAKVDTSAPSAPTLAFSALSANAYYDGSGTLYIRPAAGGTFTVTGASTDAQSGIGSYTFGTLNSNGGSNFAGSQTGDHFDYTFNGTTTAPTTSRTVSSTNGASTNSANATYTITADTTAPSVTTPGVTAGYYTSNSVAVTKNGGSDGGAGVDGTTSVLERDVANLSNGSCGSFSGSWTTVTLSGGNDTSVTNGHCYEYRERLSDRVGNQGTSAVSNIAKVDSQSPTNGLALSSVSPAGSALKNGTTIYYRGSIAGGGSFKLTNTVGDAEAGPASSATSALGGSSSGWSHSPSTVSTPSGGPYDSATFSWNAGTTSSPTEIVTAADQAGNTTPSGTLTFTDDSNAPTGGALTVNGTGATGGGTSSYSASGSFPIDSRTDYSETQSATESGLASSTLTRAAATLTAGACGSFGAPTTIGGAPAQSLSTGCYLYTLTGTDNLGNSVSVTTTVKVDTSAPAAPTLAFSNASGALYTSGTNAWFKPSSAGSVDLGASSSDADTGVSSYTFPTAGAMGASWSAAGSGASRTYSFVAGAAQPGTHSVSAANGAGGTASSNFTVSADSTAPTTSAQCNGAACLSGSYYTSAPVLVTLSADDGTGSGVEKIRYTTNGTDPTPVNGSDYSGAISIASTATVKFRAYDNLGNEEAVGSQDVLLDGTPPSLSLTLTENPASGSQHVSGTTVFYRPGSAGGTFRVSATASDPQTGVTSVDFPAVATVTGGSTQTSAPYREDYTWNASTTNATSHDVVATNGAGATTNAAFTLTQDSAAPSGQSITLTGATTPYYPSASVTFTLGDGNDGSGSGVDSSTRTVTRETAPLAGDACGTFSPDAGTFSSPDTAVSGGHCYRYSFTVADNVGNVSSAATATAKVDTASPTVAVTAPTELTGAGNQYYDSATKTQFFRSTGSGSFSLHATAADADTAIGSVGFPDLSGLTGWGGSTGGADTTSPYSSPADYNWSAGAAEPGAQVETAADKAGNTATDTITIKDDTAAPTGQAITLTGGMPPYFTGGPVTFSLTNGSDAAGGAGLDVSSASVTRETGTLSANNCSAFSADPGTFSSPDNAVSSGHCYRYTFSIADKVGNVATVSATAKVSPNAPSVSVDPPTAVTGASAQYYNSGTQTLFFRPSGAGSFALSATAVDPDTGVSKVTFPDVSAVSGWSGSTGGDDTTTPFNSPADYSWSVGAAAPGTRSVTATNYAALTNSDTITISADSNGPTGQSITLTGATAPYFGSNSVSFNLANGSDSGSGIDAATGSVTRETGTLSGDSCTGFSPDAGTFSSPDTAVSTGHCYRYSFTIADKVGNVSTAATAVAKVDTAAPTVSVAAPTAVTGAGNQYYDAGTKTLFFRSSASGSFDLHATASDTDSAVGAVSFPDLSGLSGWSGSTGGTDTTSPYSSPVAYSWSAGATAPGARTISAADKAANSASDTIAITADTTAPTGQGITLTGALEPYYATNSVTFTLANGSDNGGGAGLDLSSATVTRETATLTGDSCGSFSADPGTFASPDTAVSTGHCYRYSFTISDKVGNTSVAATVTAKVDTDNPVVSLTDPGTPVGGSVALAATASDPSTDVEQVSFERAPAGGSTWTTIGTDTTAPYSTSWNTTTLADGQYDVRAVATDKSNNTSTSVVANRRVDNTAPNTTIDTSPADPSSDSTPSFGFSSSEAGSTFACRLDGGSWNPCSSPDTISPALGAGSHTFDVRATDQAGNTDGTPASYTWTVDLTAPNTTLGSTPANPSNDTTPSFTFSSSEAGSTFECRLDGGSWSPCTSPDTISPALGAGSHTFDVRATDQAGNTDGTPASYTWTVDLTAPNTTIDSNPADPSTNTTPSFTFSSSEAGSTFECRLDGASWTPCTSPDTISPALGEGSHTFDVRATDQAGNTDGTPASYTWLVDLTAPDTTIVTSPNDPSNDTTPTFTFSSSKPSSTFECRVDGGSWNPCTSPDTISPALGAGSHTFDVRATDHAGNTDGTPASYTWTIDLTAPNTTLDSNPTSPSGDTTPSFSFSSSEPGSTFECRVDGGSWSPCSSPDTISPALTEGSHTFDVRAVDAAGNADGTPATYTWIIDTGAPTVTITDPTAYLSASDPNNYVVTATTPDGDVTHVDFFECSNASANCATGSWVQFGTDNTAPYAATWATPAFDGIKAIRAVAVDAASNTGQHIRNITIDRTAPTGVTVSYPNGYVVGSYNVTTSNGSDPDVNATTGSLQRQTGDLTNNSCSSYGGWVAATSPDTLASGKCAVYRYSVADNAGNVAVATSANEAKSDTAAPGSALDDPGANLRQTISLSATASDTGGSGVASVAFQRRPAGGGAWTTIASDSSFPYSTSFDTTSVSDGLYDFRSVATDVAGNNEGSPTVVANRRIDNTAPSAAMLSPGNPVGATVTLTSNTSDTGGSGIASVTYELAPHSGSFNSQPASWDTTLVSDGLYDLRVIATDTAGNTKTSALITTRVDNTPPAVNFSSPATGAVVSGTVNLVGSSSDASPASPAVTFAYKLHSNPPTSYTATGSSWNTTTLPGGDGLYDLRARATDDASNTTSVENTSIQVDNAPPTISITAPATAINGSVPSPTTFAANASDPAGSGVSQVQFFECSDASSNCATGVWNALGAVPAPGPYSVSWSIPVADGNHALAAVATDHAGHTATAIRNVDVDRTAPNTNIVTKPADPSNDSVPSFTFSSTESGSTFECSIDGGAFSPCTTPHTVPGLTDNDHTLEVRATDAAGNTDATPDTWTWHRDTNDPTGSLNNPGANVRQVLTLTSNENDPPANGYASGIASVAFEYSNDGSTWAPIGTNTSPPFNNVLWNTGSVTDGVYHLRIVVGDAAGNSAAFELPSTVRIDNTPPTTSQNDPGAYLRGTKTLTGSAADSGSGIDHVDFQRASTGGGGWTTIDTDSTPGDGFQAGFDTTGVSDGHYDFRTVAYDVAGNQAAATPVTDRLVDNTPPTASLTNPGPYLRAAVNLTSSTGDPGGSNASGVVTVAYEYSTNGGSTWQSTGASFNSAAVADGNVELRVVATDAAGNTTASPPVTSLADNTKPATTDNAPSGWQSSPVTVTLTGNDGGSGVNVTEYSLDGNPSYTVGTSVSIPAPADGSNDGSHTIAYFSVDNAGNIETIKSTTVLIDATPPACPSCSAADYLRGTVDLAADPDTSGSGIQSVSFEYTDAGGSTWTPIGTDTTGPGPYTTSWDTTLVPDGHYDLRIQITDNADNVTTATLPDKVVDNTAPNVALVGAPTEGQIVSGSIGIAASASDVTSPIASVKFYVRGTLLATDSSAPFSQSWGTTTGADGPATIQIVVVDMAGNTTTSAVRTVSVDNLSPTPTLADPGSNLSGTISLTASSDPDTTQVDFERRPAGGGSWVTIASDATAPWGTSLDTTALADGLYDFRAIATDGTGHTGTSPIRANVRIDNTAPAGSLTAPAAGATVGGTSVTLSGSYSDGDSGVASVRYELRPTGGGSWTTIATATGAPFSATWDATTVSSGSYDLQPVIIDNAGNTFTGATRTFTVDVSAPTVTLTNPGATISGSVTLNATVTGSGATQVVFGATPAGGGSWSTLGTDTSAPWSTTFDSTHLADGVYDLRATVSDNLGNTSSDVVSTIRIDNTAPRVISSVPAEGSTVTSANAIELVTSEPATPLNVTLDGHTTVAPVISGTQIDYGTGALATGAHTLAGELQDSTGKRAPFRVHFTVYAPGSSTPAPPVDKNTSSASSTTVSSTDGFAAATMPAGAWTTSGSDWIVLRITPLAAPTGLTNGFGSGPEALDVTARWALAGTEVHQFSRPIEILMRSTERGLVPATFENGQWRVLARVPSAGTLPGGWEDGFWTDGSGFHVLTKHLSVFALLHDLQPPNPPQNVRGFVGPSGLTIRWTPGSDNSGTYDFVTVFSNATDIGHFGVDYTAAGIGSWSIGDTRVFRLKETDLAGNESELTRPLVPVPSLIGKTPDQIAALLAPLGFKIGSITTGGTGPAGTVTGPANLALAEEGAAIDLVVAPGGAQAGLFLKVTTAPKIRPAKRRKIAARVLVTRASLVTAQLFSPKRVKLYTWRFSVRAGRSIVSLRLPAQVRRPGVYTIRWTARSGRSTVSRRIAIRFVGPRTRVAQPVRVLLAGPAADGVRGKFSSGRPKVVLASGIEPTFDAAASRSTDVRVIVVDVNQFGVGMVRDLHAVFPAAKIVALVLGPKQMAAALKAGAAIALPRSTPAPLLARIIQRLLNQPVRVAKPRSTGWHLAH